MYTEITDQIKNVTDNFLKSLSEANAIDKNGKATDIKKFDKIVNVAIQECYKISLQTEKDGVTIDKYGLNIAMSCIDRLEKMKRLKHVRPESVLEEQEKDIETYSVQKKRKTSAFHAGVSKLIERIQAKFRAPKQNENNR